MSSDRRPLWQPFSESATDAPVTAEDRARLLPVERAPFLEPGTEDVPAEAPGGRRRLGSDPLADAGLPDDRA